MKRNNLGKNLTALALAWMMLVLPMAAFGQTRIVMPKNRYKIQDDIKVGREASRQVEQQMPILNDSEATRLVQDIGRRLVSAIPAEFQQPQFQYTFDIVNARDINAFALPGGPMYVNRGMIEAARNEGEMAGVMAHELAHVALRHGTAQATEQGKFQNQLGMLGMILGGAVLGGQTGAQLGMMGAQAWMTKFSRKYETQADILGAQIMANAGYDPRDLANMFRTIARESGGSRAPEWLSSHPDPGNRYATIEREAQLLRVSPNGNYSSTQFLRVKRRLQGLPRAQTMEEIARSGSSRSGQGQSPTANGRYEGSVEYPSARMRSYNAGAVSLSIPDNWREFPSQQEIWFAPEGAYGNNGITHGALVGMAQGSGRSLQQDTENYVQGILQGNTYLQPRSNLSQTTVGGRNGLGIVLAGRSPITGRTEITTVYTTYLRNGQLFYIITVAPESEASNYNYAFRNMIRSIRLND